MQRGVIQLTVPEIQAAAEQIGSTADQTSRFLLQKLQSALIAPPNELSQVLVQMSEDEVEWLIDQLPPPIPTTPETVQNLRKKLADFLTKLRKL